MFSIASIAPVRDVAAIGRRNNPRDATGASPTAQKGAQNPTAPDSSSKTTAGKRDANQLGTKQLTPDQERLVQELAESDAKVRAHESAHQAAAGSLAGAVSFTYETGPDGKSYAVGGEVSVDMSSGRTPEETIAKAEQILSAALAPADPSPQDLVVAAEAAQMEAVARQEIVQEEMAALSANKDVSTAATASASDRLDTSGNLASSAVSSVSDVGAQAAATLATLESVRAAVGATPDQVQQLARLAVAAYGM